MSECAPLMAGTVVSHDSRGNPVSHVQANGNDNMSSVLNG